MSTRVFIAAVLYKGQDMQMAQSPVAGGSFLSFTIKFNLRPRDTLSPTGPEAQAVHGAQPRPGSTQVY